MSKTGAVILAGGSSRRMGTHKADLKLEGRTFLERITRELETFDEVLLSLGNKNRYEGSLMVVEDRYPGCGPMGGLHAALKICRSDALLAVACDMPLFEQGLADYITGFISSDYDAFVTATRDGNVHPLCAVYKKNAAEILEKMLNAENFRMMDALKQMKVKYVTLLHSVYPDTLLTNVNSLSEYSALCNQLMPPPVIAVSGVKNSGKTTLLTAILPLLRDQGVRTAVIKHDGHDFTPDVPETDSYRLREAGALAVAIYSGYRYMLTAEQMDVKAEKLFRHFHNMDLILLEGEKSSAYPKIEVVRKAVSQRPVCNSSQLLAIYTDLDFSIGDIPVVEMKDYEKIVQIIMDYIHHFHDISE